MKSDHDLANIAQQIYWHLEHGERAEVLALLRGLSAPEPIPDSIIVKLVDDLRALNTSTPGIIEAAAQALETLARERDDARDWVKRLQRDRQTLTCVYCGQEYPPGTPTHGASVLTEHIKVCEKHPMREIEARVRELEQQLLDAQLGADGLLKTAHDRANRLRAALVGIVGADGDELTAMAALLKSMMPAGEEKTRILEAIVVLQEVPNA